MKFIGILMITIMANGLLAQNMKSHQWENRVVLVIAKDLDHPDLLTQLDAFSSQPEAMADRKLLVYAIAPNGFQHINYGKNATIGEWSENTRLYQKWSNPDEDFQVLLLGLDGGVKMKDTKVISCQKLFGKIDQMPMRQSELRRRKQ